MRPQPLPELTPAERAAVDAFRAEFPAARLRKLGYRNWQAALTEAWLNDWPEQRGELRALRNSPRFDSIVDILKSYTQGEA